MQVSRVIFHDWLTMKNKRKPKRAVYHMTRLSFSLSASLISLVSVVMRDTSSPEKRALYVFNRWSKSYVFWIFTKSGSSGLDKNESMYFKWKENGLRIYSWWPTVHGALYFRVICTCTHDLPVDVASKNPISCLSTARKTNPCTEVCMRLMVMLYMRSQMNSSTALKHTKGRHIRVWSDQNIYKGIITLPPLL